MRPEPATKRPVGNGSFSMNSSHENCRCRKLVARGLDQIDTIRSKTQRYKEQLILNDLLKDKLQPKVKVTKAELDTYHESHANELLDPLKVQVSLMLLPNFPAAKDLETQVNRGGSFAALANRYSVDEKTKAKGGDLGPYRKGLVLPEVDAVVHSLKPGLISAPIKTEQGYYLVMTTPFDKEIIEANLAIQERIRQELLADKCQKRFEEVIADIRASATIRLSGASRSITNETGKNTPPPFTRSFRVECSRSVFLHS